MKVKKEFLIKNKSLSKPKLTHRGQEQNMTTTSKWQKLLCTVSNLVVKTAAFASFCESVWPSFGLILVRLESDK
jgi:hypothetical protein